MSNVLCADIGGTKTRVAFLRKGKFVLLKFYDSKKIKNITNVLKKIILEIKKRYKINIEKAAIAVAGPVLENRAKITNIKLIIDGEKLRRNLNLKKVIIINDFKAIAISIDHLSKKDLFVLKRGNTKSRNKAIIGAGTGLGASMIINKKGLVDSEGGHIDAASENELEYMMLNYLKNKLCKGKWPDYETIVSGPGIINIYRFLQKLRFYKQRKDIKQEIERSHDKAAKIVEYSYIDSLCRATVEMFVRFYARFAKTIALTSLSSEIYLAGGIAPKIIKQLKDYGFIEEFEKSYKMEKILKGASIYVIMNESAGLIGAAKYFQDV